MHATGEFTRGHISITTLNALTAIWVSAGTAPYSLDADDLVGTIDIMRPSPPLPEARHLLALGTFRRTVLVGKPGGEGSLEIFSRTRWDQMRITRMNLRMVAIRTSEQSQCKSRAAPEPLQKEIASTLA